MILFYFSFGIRTTTLLSLKRPLPRLCCKPERCARRDVHHGRKHSQYKSTISSPAVFSSCWNFLLSTTYLPPIATLANCLCCSLESCECTGTGYWHAQCPAMRDERRMTYCMYRKRSNESEGAEMTLAPCCEGPSVTSIDPVA